MNGVWRAAVLSLFLMFCAPALAQPAPPDADAPPPAQPPEPAPDEQPEQRPRASELAPNLGWLNTAEPLTFAGNLKGQVVVLDFWTSCCINCMHALDDLKFLGEKYKDQPVVFIGVHSAKFVTEADRGSIRAAVQRYAITHPIVIDDMMSIWRAYAVRSWPSFVIIGPDGLVLAETSGEGRRDILDVAIRSILDYGRRNATLAAAPLHTAVDASVPSAGGLAFPGKVHAVAPAPPVAGEQGPDDAGWLFIADSSHNRVIAATWPDADGRSQVVKVVGGVGGVVGVGAADVTAEPGFIDGPAAAARFNGPQGLAFDRARRTLYVADTKNHAVRAINLRDWTVRTLAGDATRGHDLVGGKSGRDQSLASPWDVALAPDGSSLAVAMAGAHQLWTIDLTPGGGGVAKALAGAGGEAIIDGPASEAALAQPSGLAFSPTGERLYFVDAETSSLRVLDVKAGSVKSLVGHDLFVFGDVDGPARRALMQHPLGVSLFVPAPPNVPGNETLVIADTFNHVLRVLEVGSGQVLTFVGARRGVPGPYLPTLAFNEPGGVHAAGTGKARRVFVADTNNHRVVVVDPVSSRWCEVALTGLLSEPSVAEIDPATPRVQIALVLGAPADVDVSPAIPAGFHVSSDAPVSVLVRELNVLGRAGAAIVQRTFRTSGLPVTVSLPGERVRDGARYVVEVTLGVCDDAPNASCRPVSAAWVVTITSGSESVATLR